MGCCKQKGNPVEKKDVPSEKQAVDYLKALEHFLDGFMDSVAGGDIDEFYYAIIKPELGFRLSASEKVGRDWDCVDEHYTSIAKKNGWSYVYVVEGTHQGKTTYKIGKANDVNSRVKLFSVKIPFDIKPVMSFFVQDAYALEGRLHKAMRSVWAGGEWFNLSKRHLDRVFSIGAAQEFEDNSKLVEKTLEQNRVSEMAPDHEYIEYLEAMLVMNGIKFNARK